MMPETTARVVAESPTAEAPAAVAAAQASDPGDQRREHERLDEAAMNSVKVTALSTS